MTESRLEPYREEILTMKLQGMSTAAMQRQIEQRHRVKISKSQFYAFVEQVNEVERTPEPEGALFMAPKLQPLYQPVDEETRTFHTTVLTKLDEVRKALSDIVRWISRMDENAEQREQATRAALQQFQQTLAETTAAFQVEASRASVRPPESPRRAVAPDVTSAFRAARRGMPSFAVSTPRRWPCVAFYTGLLGGGAVWLFVYGHWRPLWALLQNYIAPVMEVIARLPLHP